MIGTYGPVTLSCADIRAFFAPSNRFILAGNRNYDFGRHARQPGETMLINIPLTIAPLIVYNITVFGLFGELPGDPWSIPVFTLQMVSGARWTMVMGDLMVTAGLVLLFVEILKATRTTTGSIADHVLSTVVFIIYLVEFLTIREAASSVFFILMVIALVDVIAGFTVTIRGARRDFAVGPGEHL